MIKLICWTTRVRIALHALLAGLVHDVRFYGELWREQGLAGLRACYRLWRAQKEVGKTYNHLEAELATHEQQVALLRAELEAARREYQAALRAQRDLYLNLP
jgi:hypothetical protein